MNSYRGLLRCVRPSRNPVVTWPNAIQRNWRAGGGIAPSRANVTIPIGNCATATSTAPTSAASCSSDLTIDCSTGCGISNAARACASATASPTWSASGTATPPTPTTLNSNATGCGCCWEAFASRTAIAIGSVIDCKQ